MTAAPHPISDSLLGEIDLTFSTTQRPSCLRTLSMQLMAETPSIAEDKSSVCGAAFNLTNTIIGAGIFILPHVLSIAGFWTGLILLVFVAFLTDWTARQLVDCGVRKNRLDYELIMLFCFGKVGFYLVICSMLCASYGFMVIYHIVIGDVMHPLVLYLNDEIHGDPDAIYAERWFIVTIFSLIFMLPLSLLKNMSALSSVSTLSIAMAFIIVISVCIRTPQRAAHMLSEHRDDATLHEGIDNPISFIHLGIFQAIGAITYAFVCQHSSFIVYNSLQNADHDRWRMVSQLSVGVALVLCLIQSVTGYLYFRDAVDPSNILNNFDHDDALISFCRFLLAMTLLLTFPLQQFVARHCVMMLLESVCHRFNAQDIEEQSCRYLFNLYFVTLILWSSTLVIGASLNDAGLVLGLVGSISAPSICYILPSLAVIKTKGYWENRHHLWRTGRFVMAFFTLFFGIFVMFAGTITTIISSSSK